MTDMGSDQMRLLRLLIGEADSLSAWRALVACPTDEVAPRLRRLVLVLEEATRLARLLMQDEDA